MTKRFEKVQNKCMEEFRTISVQVSQNQWTAKCQSAECKKFAEEEKIDINIKPIEAMKKELSSDISKKCLQNGTLEGALIGIGALAVAVSTPLGWAVGLAWFVSGVTGGAIAGSLAGNSKSNEANKIIDSLALEEKENLKLKWKKIYLEYEKSWELIGNRLKEVKDIIEDNRSNLMHVSKDAEEAIERCVELMELGKENNEIETIKQRAENWQEELVNLDSVINKFLNNVENSKKCAKSKIIMGV